VNLKDVERCVGQYAGWVLGSLNIPWFCCFGTLLGFIRENGVIKNDRDIDLGIFYENLLDENRLILSMEKYNYKLHHKIINDHDKKALYLSFTSDQHPPLCIFAWYKHNGIRYHTYDTKMERKAHPSEYVFKGVPADLLEQPDENGNFKFSQYWPSDNNRKQLTQHEFYIPRKYGTLLDLWYPDWKTPRKGTSQSPYIVKMRSCKEWDNKDHVEKCLKQSQEEYENYLAAL
jgi:hypothetical protein